MLATGDAFERKPTCRALELEAGVARQFAARGVTFAAGVRGLEIPDVLVAIYGAVDVNPLRADFYGPKDVDEARTSS